jgi:hypothetical protein
MVYNDALSADRRMTMIALVPNRGLMGGLEAAFLQVF